MSNPRSIRFLIRSAEIDDLEALHTLALNSSLLNLPADREILYEKIRKSIASFACKKDVEDRQFIFVLEDQESGQVTGTSTIFSDYADIEHPLYFFSVYDENNPAPDVEVKEGYQLLRLNSQTDPISVLGGLVVDSRYRGLPEKRGKQISLVRFVFLGMYIDFFNPVVLSELMPPMEKDGSSPFWKAIGQKYTGHSYEQVFQAARLKDRSFIQDCFPKEDILLSPGQKHLHRSIYSVLDTGRAQQHMITKQGFEYLHRVDPMDGALQYGARINDVLAIKKGGYYYCEQLPDSRKVEVSALMGIVRDGRFSGGQVPVSIRNDKVLVPPAVMETVELSRGDRVFVCPV